MTDHPAQNRREIAALRHDHGGRWQIEHDPELDVWIAVRKSPDGRHIRVLVAHDPAGLRGKLADTGGRGARPGQPARGRPAWRRVDLGTVHVSAIGVEWEVIYPTCSGPRCVPGSR